MHLLLPGPSPPFSSLWGLPQNGTSDTQVGQRPKNSVCGTSTRWMVHPSNGPERAQPSSPAVPASLPIPKHADDGTTPSRFPLLPNSCPWHLSLSFSAGSSLCPGGRRSCKVSAGEIRSPENSLEKEVAPAGKLHPGLRILAREPGLGMCWNRGQLGSITGPVRRGSPRPPL